MAAERFSRTTEEVLTSSRGSGPQPDLESGERRDLWVTFQEALPLETSRCGRGSGEPQDQLVMGKKSQTDSCDTHLEHH